MSASPKTLKIALDARKNEFMSGLAEKENALPLVIVVPRYFQSVTKSMSWLPIISGTHC